MTPAEIFCRSEGRDVADRHGLAAIMSTTRGSPQIPATTGTHVVESVADPGCRNAKHRLSPVSRPVGRPGLSIAKSTVTSWLAVAWTGDWGAWSGSRQSQR